MGEHFFEVLLSDYARDTYVDLQREATLARRFNCVSPRSPRASEWNGTIEHYEHTRKLLRELGDPALVHLDQRMIGNAAPIQSRTSSTTCVYFSRNLALRVVTVYDICRSTLDYSALANVVLSGNTKILRALGIVPPSIPKEITIH